MFLREHCMVKMHHSFELAGSAFKIVYFTGIMWFHAKMSTEFVTLLVLVKKGLVNNEGLFIKGATLEVIKPQSFVDVLYIRNPAVTTAIFGSIALIALIPNLYFPPAVWEDVLQETRQIFANDGANHIVHLESSREGPSRPKHEVDTLVAVAELEELDVKTSHEK
jgi:hypothetical protein